MEAVGATRRAGPPTRLALIGLIVFVGFLVVVLPQQAASGAGYTERAAAPDTRFWYSADDLYAAADAWGPAGRAAYVTARVSFDVIWPLAYGFFLLTALGWLGARLLPAASPWRALAWLPVLVVALDFAENACTAIVMTRYPERTAVLADLAGVFTAGKWATLSVAFALLLGSAAALAVRTVLRAVARGRLRRAERR
jgi:hypothetical protein